MEIREFLAELARDCDPVWREQVTGIAENYERFGAITAKQKRSIEVETHKLRRHMPDGWADLPLRDPVSPSPPPVPSMSAEREAIATALEDLAIAVAKVADRLRA